MSRLKKIIATNKSQEIHPLLKLCIMNKAKLIKTSKDSHHNGHYFLNDGDGFAIGSTDKDWCKRAVKKKPLYILSLSNCQSIERGYDLDELAEAEYPILNLGLNATTSLHTLHQESFKVGFQEAIKILSDKKFSEEDILIAIEFGYHTGINHNDDEEESLGEIIMLKDSVIRSLQQTEWDVEFNPDELDEDGCLILKRIKSE